MSNIAPIPDGPGGTPFTEEQYAAIEGSINDGVVNQRGTQVHATGNQNIGSNSTATVSFDTVDMDADGMYDASKPTVLTVRTAGWYMIAGSLNFTADGSGNTREAFIKVSGTIVAKNGRQPRDGSHSVPISIATLHYCNVGDTIQLVGNWDATAGGQLITNVEYGNYLRACRL